MIMKHKIILVNNLNIDIREEDLQTIFYRKGKIISNKIWISFISKIKISLSQIEIKMIKNY